jgi:hypothetical protein
MAPVVAFNIRIADARVAGYPDVYGLPVNRDIARARLAAPSARPRLLTKRKRGGSVAIPMAGSGSSLGCESRPLARTGNLATMSLALVAEPTTSVAG